jgi:glutaredoxin|tara:strand:+ start:673 stop:924 length:252 start_codon:yes stop_codon:yes gene_type:complete
MFDSYLLYIKNSCPFCVRATQELNNRGLEYRLIEVDDCPEEFIAQLKDGYDHESFPMIMGYDETYESYNWIGGYEDLVEDFDE